MKKKKTFILLSFTISFFIIGILLQQLPVPQVSMNNPWRRESGDPMVIVHGGAKELFPENTALAFQEITKMKIDAIEIDLALTKDNILITNHDLSIDRMSNGSGLVRDMDYDQIRQFDFADGFAGINNDYPYRGHKLAYPEKMEVLFQKYPDFFYVIELKNEGETGRIAAGELYRLITVNKMENRVLIASFHDDTLNYFSEISNGELLLSTAKNEALRFVIFEKLRIGPIYKPRTHVLEVPISEKVAGVSINLSSQHFIDEAHKHGMAVHYWTINNRDEMERLIKLGVDGIITDRPDIMIELLGK